MTRFLYAILLELLPLWAFAETSMPPDRGPLGVSLKQYGLVLGAALFGGLVNYWRRVQRGELQKANVSALIGELATSAFAGLLMFWGCQYFGVDPNLTAMAAGLAGHAGSRGINWIETVMKRKAAAAGIK